MRVFRFVALAIALLASVLLWGRNGKRCAYGDRAYADEAFKMNEAVCQQCKDGSWFDKTNDNCETESPPEAERPLRGRYDCVYGSGIYSNGAYHRNRGNCQRCGSGTFVDAPNSSCSTR